MREAKICRKTNETDISLCLNIDGTGKSNINYNGNLFSIEDIRSLSSDYTSSDKKWIDKLICSYESLKLNFDIMKLNVITDNITDNEYDFPIVEFSDFLKSKILKLNTL